MESTVVEGDLLDQRTDVDPATAPAVARRARDPREIQVKQDGSRAIFFGIVTPP